MQARTEAEARCDDLEAALEAAATAAAEAELARGARPTANGDGGTEVAHEGGGASHSDATKGNDKVCKQK